MKTFFIIFPLACFISASAAVPQDLTPAQALQALKTSNDLQELAAAIKVAATNPGTRPDLLAFFASQSRWNDIEVQYGLAHLPLTADQIKNHDFMMQWAKNNKDAVEKFNEDWQRLQQSVYTDLDAFFAQSKDPAMFDVFQHFCDTKVMDFHLGGDYEIFAAALPPGSVLTPLLLDYADHNAQTGEADRPGRAGDRGYWFSTMAAVNTNEAYARIQAGILAGKYREQDVIVLLGDSLVYHRYDPGVFYLFQAALEKFSEKGKISLISCLFGQWSGTNTPFPQLDQADPLLYPKLLKLIYDLQKLDLSQLDPRDIGQSVSSLNYAKAKLLALYAQHGMTPPTDAELAAMPDITIPAPPAASAPAKSSISARPTAPTVEASPLPLYVIGGTIAVLAAAFIFFRRK